MPLKRCTQCKEEKDLLAFYNSKASKDGKSYRCKDCDKVAGIAYRKRHKERDRRNRRNTSRRIKYGLTPEVYDQMLKDQNGKCPICQKQLREGWTKNHHKNRACIDHCHKTNKVRGILCTMCNKGLGLLGDDLEGIIRAKRYLEGKE